MRMIQVEYYQIIASRITALCKARGIAINKLAAMSNIKQSTADNIMRGISKNPTIQTLHKISLSFGMTLAEFLDYPELNEFSFDDNTPDEELQK